MIQENNSILKMVNCMKELYFGGGCFWGVQDYFDRIQGVIKTEVGYAFGNHPPTYEEVCQSKEYVEVVKVTFHTYQISLLRLLDFFYELIQPTKQKKGQYRLGIYYQDPEDEKMIMYSLKRLQTQYHKKIKIECLPIQNYTKAESYHQDYLKKHPTAPCQLEKRLCMMVEAENQLKEKPLSFYVTKERGSEPPFYSSMYCEKREGVYVDIDTKVPLFSSEDKIYSDSGYPCFSKPIQEDVIQVRFDLRNFKIRKEVYSSSSHNHLGYVLKKDGKRQYCINSVALTFIPKEK